MKKSIKKLNISKKQTIKAANLSKLKGGDSSYDSRMDILIELADEDGD